MLRPEVPPYPTLQSDRQSLPLPFQTTITRSHSTVFDLPSHPSIYPSTYCFPPTGSIARLQRRSPPNSTESFPKVTPPPLFRCISNLFSRTRPATIEYTLCILHTRRAQCNAYPPPMAVGKTDQNIGTFRFIFFLSVEKQPERKRGNKGNTLGGKEGGLIPSLGGRRGIMHLPVSPFFLPSRVVQ